ncbi:peptidoglycan-binding protein [Salipaludibacillus sp. CF4.18]|uniref:peptidoglycan-binding protein n=1 Tax=Salipaludibacillus sp. CF4.18 TaxID=3373081 RepID=UPI003EE59A7B
MSKHLIIAGHGLQPNGTVDPGAHGSGTNESEFLREKFIPAMKKYAPDNMDFYTKNNFYGHQLAPSLKGYEQVTELHLDWAKSASGGHVIIYKDYSPDNVDKAIRDVVKNNVGLRSGDGFSYRSDLYNLNTFASRNITYRLIELGFINNAEDMKKIRGNIDDYAKDLVEAIIGEKVEPVKKEVKQASKPKPTPSKPEPKKEVTGITATIQSTLNSRYGLSIAVDNLFGNETKGALVKALQSELNRQTGANLTVDGKFGPKTKGACVNVSEGARGNITWILQATLHCEGFKLGAIDSVFGKLTKNAVMSYQGANKLQKDGIAGVKTFQMLFK